MSQRIYLWMDGAEAGPFEERDVRERVVRGTLNSWTLARGEQSASDSWLAVRELLTQRDQGDRVEDILARRGRYAFENPTPDRVDRAAKIIVGAFAAAVAVLWMVSQFTSSAVGALREPTRRDAYRSAREFAMNRLPGAREVAHESQAIVERDGANWYVAFVVDGLNAFGGPVRRNVVVQMRCDGSDFSFVTLKQ